MLKLLLEYYDITVLMKNIIRIIIVFFLPSSAISQAPIMLFIKYKEIQSSIGIVFLDILSRYLSGTKQKISPAFPT